MSRRACDASAGDRVCRSGSASLRGPRQHECLHPFQRRLQLVPLNGSGRIDMLRTDLGAFADERTAPDAIVLGEDLHPLCRSLVAAVQIVALREGDGGRANEVWIEAIYGARGVAEHAVDAHAE